MISEPREAGKHGWRCACRPGPSSYTQFDTFSVGIFQWVLRSNSRHWVKPGKCLVRVRGPTEDPDKVDALVADIIKALDAGEYTGPKVVSVEASRCKGKS